MAQRIVSSDPVQLEPPFRPFIGHFTPPQLIWDDGVRETGLGRRNTKSKWASSKIAARQRHRARERAEFARVRRNTEEGEIIRRHGCRVGPKLGQTGRHIQRTQVERLFAVIVDEEDATCL
jgi:hypothetical protein